MVAGALLELEGFPEIDALKAFINIDEIPQKKVIKVEEKPVNNEVPRGFALQALGHGCLSGKGYGSI